MKRVLFFHPFQTDTKMKTYLFSSRSDQNKEIQETCPNEYWGAEHLSFTLEADETITSFSQI